MQRIGKLGNLDNLTGPCACVDGIRSPAGEPPPSRYPVLLPLQRPSQPFLER